MPTFDHWLLPEGIEEVLPPQAWRLEQVRRRLFDLYRSWGYELIVPPLLEYLEPLLTGAGNDLDLQTFKLTDQLTGRLMGIRADITPQAARIDAHQLKRDVPVRLCYLGTVLHTRPDGFAGSRAPLQLGAELFGHAGIESDVEIVLLMLETLAATGVQNIHLDVGHVGIFRGLAHQAGLDRSQETALFGALQRKALPEIRELVASFPITERQREQLTGLAELHGSDEVLDQARQMLQDAGPKVQGALNNLQDIATAVRRRNPELPLYYDLAELRGYHYHTGFLFAAFIDGVGQEIARGGRYDDVGRIFGRARPATGFSTDLKILILVSADQDVVSERRIFAPAEQDRELQAVIDSLRDEGESVVCLLPGQVGGPREMGCDRQLVHEKGGWKVVELVKD
ncbi:MAG: ATP phosphoribosyltransferase regulatory subunit [Gammaproteobacteria bacterium]